MFQTFITRFMCTEFVCKLFALLLVTLVCLLYVVHILGSSDSLCRVVPCRRKRVSIPYYELLSHVIGGRTGPIVRMKCLC